MITTSITITPYLAEYIVGKYNNGASEPVTLPHRDDLYHLLWSLMQKRPKDYSPVDEGNLTLMLPNRRDGKCPKTYNYLSERSAKILHNRIRSMFNQELHDELMVNDRKGRPLDNVIVAHQILCNYCIESISPESCMKNYYRWRQNLRKRGERKVRRDSILL